MLIGFERIYHDCIEKHQKSTYSRLMEMARRSGESAGLTRYGSFAHLKTVRCRRGGRDDDSSDETRLQPAWP